ncbi:hypothetical protein RB195_005640 [Necator americanus]|uniref:Palmitoyltransferase n=1 Tax=Necator americanus TaxID=51031 RepID=A0ABR1BQE5_NECAM
MLCHRPSGLQLLSYFLTVLLFPVACVSSISVAFPICTVCLIASYVFVYAQNIFLTFYDVSPDELIIRRKQGIKPVAFDPRRHTHVIERGFCNICQIHVMFVVLLTSIVFLSGGATILGFIQMFLWISDTDHMQEINGQMFPFDVPLWLWLLASFVSFAAHLAIAAVTAHLLQFHIKLWKKGMTTYRFITDQRQRKTTVSRETISAQNEEAIHHELKEEHAVGKFGDTLTPRIADVQQRLPSHMQTDANMEKSSTGFIRLLGFALDWELQIPPKAVLLHGITTCSQIELDRAAYRRRAVADCRYLPDRRSGAAAASIAETFHLHPRKVHEYPSAFYSL